MLPPTEIPGTLGALQLAAGVHTPAEGAFALVEVLLLAGEAEAAATEAAVARVGGRGQEQEGGQEDEGEARPGHGGSGQEVETHFRGELNLFETFSEASRTLSSLLSSRHSFS